MFAGDGTIHKFSRKAISGLRQGKVAGREIAHFLLFAYLQRWSLKRGASSVNFLEVNRQTEFF